MIFFSIVKFIFFKTWLNLAANLSDKKGYLTRVKGRVNSDLLITKRPATLMQQRKK